MGKILLADVVALLLGWLFWGEGGFYVMLLPVLFVSPFGMIACAALEGVAQKDCDRFAKALVTRHDKD